MHRWVWQIDKDTQIKLEDSFFGAERVFVNGEKIVDCKNFFKLSGEHIFELKDGRKAKIRIKLIGFYPVATLELDDQLILSMRELSSLKCPSCLSIQATYDFFCKNCGAELPKHVEINKQLKVKKATQSILIVGLYFFIIGLGIHFLNLEIYGRSYKDLSKFSDSDIYPQMVDGAKYTVGELKAKLQEENYSVLLANMFVALIMFALSFWSRRNPFGATVAASVVYVSVIVLNAIENPISLAQGIWLKIFIMTILYSGIKSASEVKSQKMYRKL